MSVHAEFFIFRGEKSDEWVINKNKWPSGQD